MLDQKVRFGNVLADLQRGARQGRQIAAEFEARVREVERGEQAYRRAGQSDAKKQSEATPGLSRNINSRHEIPLFVPGSAISPLCLRKSYFAFLELNDS